MTIPTCAVHVAVTDSDNNPAVAALISAKLDRDEVYLDAAVPATWIEVYTDNAGEAILDLFPNDLGSQGSSYVVTIDARGAAPKTYRIVVPDAPTAEFVDLVDLYPGQTVATSLGGLITEDGVARPLSSMTDAGTLEMTDQLYVVRDEASYSTTLQDVSDAVGSNGTGITDGDKVDITVSGDVWSINTAAKAAFPVSTDQAAADAAVLAAANAASVAGLALKLNLSGGSVTGPISAPSPTIAAHLANKSYVDGIATNVGKRARARVVISTNITIATALNAGDVQDGVTLANGDIVLLRGQTGGAAVGAENGLYVVGAVPARTTEFDTWAEFPGSLIAIYEGTVGNGTVWLCTSNAGGTLGTTPITFDASGTSGGLVAANNFSDVADAALALENIGGVAQAGGTLTDGTLDGITAQTGASLMPFSASSNVIDIDASHNYTILDTASETITFSGTFAAGIGTRWTFANTSGGNCAVHLDYPPGPITSDPLGIPITDFIVPDGVTRFAGFEMQTDTGLVLFGEQDAPLSGLAPSAFADIAALSLLGNPGGSAGPVTVVPVSALPPALVFDGTVKYDTTAIDNRTLGATCNLTSLKRMALLFVSGTLAASTINLPSASLTSDRELEIKFTAQNGLVQAITWGGGAVDSSSVNMLPLTVFGPTTIRLWWSDSDSAWHVLEVWRRYGDDGTVDSMTAASTLNLWLAKGKTVHITGTTPIDNFGQAPAGIRKRLIFGAGVVVNHGANIVIEGALPFTAANGDYAEAESTGGSGNDDWFISSFTRLSGQPLVIPLLETALTVAAWQVITPTDALRVRLTNQGPYPGVSLIYWTGSTSWHPIGEQTAVLDTTTVPGALSAAVQCVKTIAIPAGLFYKQHVEVDVLWAKDGVTNAAGTLQVQIDATSGTTSGQVLYSDVTGIIAGNLTRSSRFRFRSNSSTTVLRQGLPGTNSPFEGGASSLAPEPSTATPNQVSAILYFNFVATMSGTTNKPAVAYVRFRLLPHN